MYQRRTQTVVVAAMCNLPLSTPVAAAHHPQEKLFPSVKGEDHLSTTSPPAPSPLHLLLPEPPVGPSGEEWLDRPRYNWVI